MCLAHLLIDNGFEMENSCLCSLDFGSEELLAVPALFFFNFSTLLTVISIVLFI